MMRLHDWNGDGLVEVGLLPRILGALLHFRFPMNYYTYVRLSIEPCIFLV